MTHGEFPWKKARRGLPPEAASTEPIQHQDMKELGLQKLDLIERDNPIYEGVISEILSQGLAENSSNRIAQGGVHDWLKTLLQCRVAPIPHLSFLQPQHY